jgi:hypothetical protein
MSTIKGKRRIL